MGKINRPKITEEAIEKALWSTGGFISKAAKKLKVTQPAISQRIKKSKKLQSVMMEIQDSILDLAEDMLIKRIRKKDLGAICFFLKCKGKHRGYIERQEMDIGNREEKPFKFDFKVKYVDPEE